MPESFDPKFHILSIIIPGIARQCGSGELSSTDQKSVEQELHRRFDGQTVTGEEIHRAATTLVHQYESIFHPAR